MTRLRLVHLIVQPVVMVDDGEHLTPVEAGQMIVSAAELEDFPVRFTAQLIEQEAALQGQPLPEDPARP